MFRAWGAFRIVHLVLAVQALVTDALHLSSQALDLGIQGGKLVQKVPQTPADQRFEVADGLAQHFKLGLGAFDIQASLLEGGEEQRVHHTYA
jgi:hypothetical protein